MKLHHLEGRKCCGYTTFGCVWDKGEVYENNFSLKNESGEYLPVQSQITAWWPDKSVKWSTHTADARSMEACVEVLPGMVGEISDRKEKGGWINETEEYFCVDTGKLRFQIKRRNPFSLAENMKVRDILMVKSICPVFVIEHRDEYGSIQKCERQMYSGEITSVEMEEAGPLQAVFCFRGKHVEKQESGAVMPFVIRMYVWRDSEEIKFQHTFLYDGIENSDFLKGMGIQFELCMSEKLYDRHVQFGTDKMHFHEAAVILSSNHPRVGGTVLQNQMDGKFVEYECTGKDSKWDELCENVKRASEEVPVWNDYIMYQDSAYHYRIEKRTEKECCKISCMEGRRAPGVMAVNSKNGGIVVGVKDFWQKYPSGFEVNGLGKRTFCTAWFYSPEAPAFDFRHYSKKSYPRTCYEGFDFVGASAYGIGVTSECRIRLSENFITPQEMYDFAEYVQKPPIYVGEPGYYHEKKAFGFWSLPDEKTEVESWLNKQLEKSFLFYQEEIEARNWYGLFDYGDIMHTYDEVRHVWKYDMGGMAWQNTELVPTYWLWLYFLRTGREDVFTMAEAMTRHCSEVDTYHLGVFKGIGSRHNVRHWGCSCKEPRIAMAGHHRFLYYLTGDARLKDIFQEVKDADYATMEKEKKRAEMENRSFEPEVRSGPDWSSFVSNWMTWYEMTLDADYRRKIETGIRDISNTPFGLASGPDYGYDVETSHLIYKGEIETTPNQHLQICMGGPQIWWETAQMLEDDTLNQLMENLGAFYYLDAEEKSRLTGGRIRNRSFGGPLFATGIAGYSAMRRGDKALAEKTWKVLIGELWQKSGCKGYEKQEYAKENGGISCEEIPWITTNKTSQWGLNVMMCMEFIREYLPKTMEELVLWMNEEKTEQ